MTGKNQTTLKQHKQNKKNLNPPFLASGLDMKTSSWFDERLPEMLWAVLIIGNTERETALRFFRYIAKYVEENKKCSDITITGISKLEEETKELLINHICSFSEEVTNILSSLLLFLELPNIEIWNKYLDISNTIEAWERLGNGVSKTFWHQSDEATDCRWVKVLCQIVGGKVKLRETMGEQLQEILEYPDCGDMRKVRPSIRAMEMACLLKNEEGSVWAKYFWKYCFDNTDCVEEDLFNTKINNRQEQLEKEVQGDRTYYFDETFKLRNELISHFFNTAQGSAIDSRHEGAFGLVLYGLSIYIETILYRTSLSITGRLGLRALVEIYIIFSYLLQNEVNENKIWDDYRAYGTGQIKLIYLKLQELESISSSINLEELNDIANEDKWVEFVPINLGHWDSVNLREMSIKVGLKSIYDKFYSYSSGFTHGNWGAVRESVYQKCINPLHRSHRIPIYDIPLMSSTMDDIMDIMNSILDCLSKAYPEFKYRLSKSESSYNK
jgi:hypothetical protein